MWLTSCCDGSIETRTKTLCKTSEKWKMKNERKMNGERPAPHLKMAYCIAGRHVAVQYIVSKPGLALRQRTDGHIFMHASSKTWTAAALRHASCPSKYGQSPVPSTPLPPPHSNNPLERSTRTVHPCTEQPRFRLLQRQRHRLD